MKTHVLHKLPRCFILGPNVTGWFRDKMFMVEKPIGSKRAARIISACIACPACEVKQVCGDTPEARRLMGCFLRQVNQPKNIDGHAVFNIKTTRPLQYPQGAAFIEIQSDGKLKMYLPAILKAKRRVRRLQKKMRILGPRGRLVPALAA